MAYLVRPLFMQMTTPTAAIIIIMMINRTVVGTIIFKIKGKSFLLLSLVTWVEGNVHEGVATGPAGPVVWAEAVGNASSGLTAGEINKHSRL